MTDINAPKHFNILLADDEIAVTKTVSFVLKRAGHTIDVAFDGDQALAKIQEDPQRYDVLITDHTMKKMSGLELVGHLRDTSFHGAILVLSANLTLSVEEAYQALGVTKFIYKPFELDDLRKAVTDLTVPSSSGNPV